MNKLRANPYRAASRLAVAGILLLVFGGVAWSQTVYSTPVRVTNTPLPVAAPEATPVYVAPSGGRLPVQVVNSSVNVSAASPLPVTASGTLPVAQQGTVTVTPAGGQMPVTISGTPTVDLRGTPPVTLAGTGNTVKLAGTPFIQAFEIVNTPPGTRYNRVFLAPGFDNKAIEVETVTVWCSVDTDQKIMRSYIEVLLASGTTVYFPIPMMFQGSDPFSQDFWVGSVPGRFYLPSDAMLQFTIDRQTATGWARCYVSMAGRKHDAF